MTLVSQPAVYLKIKRPQSQCGGKYGAGGVCSSTDLNLQWTADEGQWRVNTLHTQEALHQHWNNTCNHEEGRRRHWEPHSFFSHFSLLSCRNCRLTRYASGCSTISPKSVFYSNICLYWYERNIILLLDVSSLCLRLDLWAFLNTCSPKLEMHRSCIQTFL